jgi:hypothetical protein
MAQRGPAEAGPQVPGLPPRGPGEPGPQVAGPPQRGPGERGAQVPGLPQRGLAEGRPQVPGLPQRGRVEPGSQGVGLGERIAAEFGAVYGAHSNGIAVDQPAQPPDQGLPERARPPSYQGFPEGRPGPAGPDGVNLGDTVDITAP